MSAGRSQKRDITELFSDDLDEQTLVEPEVSSTDRPADQVSPLPLPDPLGLLERLSDGRVRDPFRHIALNVARRLNELT